MIAAIDCDLRKHYCVRVDGKVLLKGADNWVGVHNDNSIHIVLFEIASAVDYTPASTPNAKSIAHNKRRWTIWNIAQAVKLDDYFTDNGVRFLVAPSSAWTKGYELKARHFIAKCQQKQKDLRECEAMIAFYRMDPTCWKPLNDYLENV